MMWELPIITLCLLKEKSKLVLSDQEEPKTESLTMHSVFRSVVTKGGTPQDVPTERALQNMNGRG